jgi:hypothetical protein
MQFYGNFEFIQVSKFCFALLMLDKILDFGPSMIPSMSNDELVPNKSTIFTLVQLKHAKSFTNTCHSIK